MDLSSIGTGNLLWQIPESNSSCAQMHGSVMDVIGKQRMVMVKYDNVGLDRHELVCNFSRLSSFNN